MDKDNMIKMKVTGLTIDPFTNMPIIILKDEDEKTALPLWIGLIEASSIATVLEKMEVSRPMTHDLISKMIKELGAKVDSIEITDLTDNTFFSSIKLKQKDKEITLDSRPSDAIALALRSEANIYVDKTVVEKSRRMDATQKIDEGKIKEQQWAELLESLSPEDFGKYKM
jgi:hypothetical protein